MTTNGKPPRFQLPTTPKGTPPAEPPAESRPMATIQARADRIDLRALPGSDSTLCVMSNQTIDSVILLTPDGLRQIITAAQARLDEIATAAAAAGGKLEIATTMPDGL